MKNIYLSLLCYFLFFPVFIDSQEKQSARNPIPDTGQNACYDNFKVIVFPKPGQPFYGQDAQYEGNIPSYRNNGDGTISDLHTGLMWSQGVDKNKVSLIEAEQIAKKMNLGGHSDWRVPDIKELYSLIDFRGSTGFSRGNFYSIPSNAIPYINTDYFAFEFGDIKAGERYIDAQWLSSTKYASTTMSGNETLFGVNFADGRIKGYGYKKSGRSRELKKFFARYVRGPEYGKNSFKDNGDGTITDQTTGLMWMQKDSGKAMTWQESLQYAENLVYAGYNDWRLPNAKELQYIVDYSRSPDTTNSPAIAAIFHTTAITNEDGKKDYPYFWTSTSHLDGPTPGSSAVYVSFGRALGKMHEKIMDVHGAGAQRSDFKTGKPMSHGPQGDMVRIQNYVRCVRGGSVSLKSFPSSENKNAYPYKLKIQGNISSKNSDKVSTPPSGGMGFVKRLDRDGDGRVSRAEFDGPKNRFDYHDKNKDGYITEEEAPTGPPPGHGKQPR